MMVDRAVSALKWWADAGVDTIVGEEPRNWLRPAPAPARVETPAPQAETAPATLSEFQAWLLGDSIPLASSAPRLAPAGDPSAGLMVLIDMPSAADAQAGALISGEAGALFDKMLSAIGRSRETLYLASISPSRTPTGNLDATSARALAEIARRHVGLVRPRALLLFGDGAAKALLGSGAVAARGRWHELDTPQGKIKTLVTIRPEKLLNQPALKRHAWEDLQLLMEELKG